jgi:hypothetical protein
LAILGCLVTVLKIIGKKCKIVSSAFMFLFHRLMGVFQKCTTKLFAPDPELIFYIFALCNSGGMVDSISSH